MRDLLLGRELHDVDIAFRGGEKDFLQRFPSARNTGGEFGIWLADGVEYTAAGNSWEANFQKRDLTVNACAIDADGFFYGHPEFIGDLRGHTLRLVSKDALEDDPLRIFRIARFAASMPEFSVDSNTLNWMETFSRHSRSSLASLPRERIVRELMHVLRSLKPSNFIRVLQKTGSLEPWFSEFAAAGDIPAGPFPWHDNSVLEHTLEVMDRCAGHPLAVWMAMCHDLGKIMTRPADLPHHYGHEKKGADMARAFGERLGMPSKYIRAGVIGTICHMKGGMYGSLRAGTKRDLLLQIKNAGISHDFWILAGADGNVNWEPAAMQDLKVMEAVRLPEQWRNRGEESGRRLRGLQCEAISRLPQLPPKKFSE